MAVEQGALPVAAARWVPRPTLPGHVYRSEEHFELERRRIFHKEWFCVGRAERLAGPGDLLTVDVAGESIIIARNGEGVLRAFYNVCAHRGTRLCDPGTSHAKSNVIKCPYHAWTFDLDGRIAGTPNVHEEEGFDREQHHLWGVAVDEWDGFLFVNLSDEPRPLAEWIRDDPTGPGDFGRYGVSGLRIGATLSHEVAANWKIIVDNYNECLHCPNVHPELVKIVPIYRKGEVLEKDGWGGVTIVGGTRSSFTKDGISTLPRLPGIDDVDASAYYGYHLFPNLLMNLLSDCVFSMMLFPHDATSTTVVTEFMFTPETIAEPAFDPSPIVEFVDLVLRQDWEVCERAQIGNSSRAFDRGGVLPYNDRLIASTNEYYLSFLDGEVPETGRA
jgi:Rieske 2Fe-2S family protein